MFNLKKKKSKKNLIKNIYNKTGLSIYACIEIYKKYKEGNLSAYEKVEYGLPLNKEDVIDAAKLLIHLINDINNQLKDGK